MTKILVTGANGIIGRHVCRLLKEHNSDIDVIPFCGDLCVPSDVDKHFINKHYDYIIHLASMVAVSDVDNNPAQAYSVNVGGTAHLLQSMIAASKHNKTPLPYFFLASSAHIYQSKESDITESDPVGSHTLYGRTKYMAEQVAGDICTQENINLLIGRIFSFYDEAQKIPFLYPSIMNRLAHEDLTKPFELYGAESIRDISKASDIATLILKLILKKSTGTINIASGKAIKISDFVQSLAYKKLNIMPKGTVNRLTADITLLKKVLNDTTF
jgi:nucleoside-diphosphate-sugar epimerase